MRTTEELLSDRCLNGDELLMNTHTGSIDTSENWASELAGTDMEEDFFGLAEVNEDGEEI